MKLASDQYDCYMVPLPAGLAGRHQMEYVLRQIDRRHPCLESSKLDIYITRKGRAQQALVTVVSDAVLLSVLASAGKLSGLTTRDTGWRRIFRNGPVHQLHRTRKRLYLALCCLLAFGALTACVTRTQPAGGIQREQLPEEQVPSEQVWYEADYREEDEEVEEKIDLPDTDFPVAEEEEIVEESVESVEYIVGKVMDDEGNITLFYRDETGRLVSRAMGGKKR